MMNDDFGFVPDHWGNRFKSCNGSIGYFSLAPGSINLKAKVNFFIVFFGLQLNRIAALNSDKKIYSVAPVGSLEIIPQDSELLSIWSSHKENVMIALADSRLRQLAGLECGDDELEIYPVKFGVVDEAAHSIAQAMNRELALDEIGRGECLDALLTSFGVHVIRNYSNLSSKYSRMNIHGGLSPVKWKMIDDYIADHISEKITIEAMANAVSLSPGHFSRAFKETAGVSPHQYILRKRLSIARMLLSSSGFSLSEVARFAGFASNSHMTSVMKRFLGLTPRQVRRENELDG